MNISFTGYKNVGAIGFDIQTGNDEDDDKTLEYRCINLQLDNKGNKDLDNFEKVLKNFPNNINHNFLTVASFQTKAGEFNVTQPQITLNFKDLDLTDENLWIYEKLVKLLDNVSKQSNKNFVTNKDYIESEDCKKMLYPLNIGGFDEIDQEILIRLCHDPDRVKPLVADMSETLEKTVIDYLA